MSWATLDREKTKALIEQIQHHTDIPLFNPMTSEAKSQILSFYRHGILYRLTNYATLPSFTMDYIGHDEKFYRLDGSADTLYSLNDSSGFILNIQTVMPYLRFFLENVRVEDGEVFLVEDLDKLAFIESLDPMQITHIEENFKAPQISYEMTLGAFVVRCTLYFMGILMHTSVRIDMDGTVSILDQSMLMQAHLKPGYQRHS